MSTRGWRLRIEDMLEALQRIELYTAAYDYQRWLADEKTIDAVVRNFEVIGEAASHVPDHVQAHYPDIPWGMMRGFRNILIHEYFGIDAEIIWKTVIDDLPLLKRHLLEVISSPP